MSGPGTELAKIIAGDIKLGPFHINITRFGVPFKPNCNCETRVQLMDSWGVVGCARHRDKIIGWLQDSAQREGLPLPYIVAAKMVDLAIHNAK